MTALADANSVGLVRTNLVCEDDDTWTGGQEKPN
ncbi:uncharacterized protein FTOL_13826 [Fusarium torulosum]|uniref:Uncharacterized protein n=1 Tax=Fusarium torulosum TaxID=33205 RepID=A0AAE8MN66_9HYPO|nr:uncharacterized protein FTOL_13826 [Fusarium torulosum]